MNIKEIKQSYPTTYNAICALFTATCEGSEPAETMQCNYSANELRSIEQTLNTMEQYRKGLSISFALGEAYTQGMNERQVYVDRFMQFWVEELIK